MTPEEFFAGSDLAFAVFDRVRAIASTVGDIEVRVGKSEVALCRCTRPPAMGCTTSKSALPATSMRRLRPGSGKRPNAPDDCRAQAVFGVRATISVAAANPAAPIAAMITVHVHVGQAR